MKQMMYRTILNFKTLFCFLLFAAPFVEFVIPGGDTYLASAVGFFLGVIARWMIGAGLCMSTIGLLQGLGVLKSLHSDFIVSIISFFIIAPPQFFNKFLQNIIVAHQLQTIFGV